MSTIPAALLNRPVRFLGGRYTPQACGGERIGGGGGNRTRVHGRLGGVSTGLAGALISLAAPASAGCRLPAPISLGCARSEQRDRTPAHLMTPRAPAVGEPGAMRHLIN